MPESSTLRVHQDWSKLDNRMVSGLPTSDGNSSARIKWNSRSRRSGECHLPVQFWKRQLAVSSSLLAIHLRTGKNWQLPECQQQTMCRWAVSHLGRAPGNRCAGRAGRP